MTENTLTVRPLTEDDVEDWLRLRKRLWDAVSDEDHRLEMMEILDDPESQLVLVAEDGRSGLAGFLEASIRPFVEDCETDNVGYLEGWYVDPEHRRKGIGTALARAAETWARERGCTEMASDAEIGNALSLATHQSIGYKETSRLIHLRKELGKL